jgi:hypothetical protein
MGPCKLLAIRPPLRANRHCRAETQRSACLRSTHPKQQCVLALLARVRDLPADIDRFAADIENDIANLKAVIGGDSIRADGPDHEDQRIVVWAGYAASRILGTR